MGPITVSRQMIVAKNYKELCSNVVQNILLLSQKAIKEHGRFTLVLSGGVTPQGVYSLMAKRPYCDQFDWEKIQFFVGDERWVSSESLRSNYKMVSDVLFTKADIPTFNVHTIKTDTPDIQTARSLYEKKLIKYFALKLNKLPKFDLILLGLGQDGHIASLFPHHPNFDKTNHLVVAVEDNNLLEKRITLTLPVINSAHNIFFLVSGLEKSEILKKVLEGKKKGLFPAGKVNPDQGHVWWFVDQAAASLCESKYENSD